MSEVQESPNKIYFKFDPTKLESMSWEEFEAFERWMDGEGKLYQLRQIMAQFVTDKEGKPLLVPVAMKMLGRLSINQIEGVVKSFMDAVSDQAIPKAKGDGSSGVSAQEATSPVGASH